MLPTGEPCQLTQKGDSAKRDLTQRLIQHPSWDAMKATFPALDSLTRPQAPEAGIRAAHAILQAHLKDGLRNFWEGPKHRKLLASRGINTGQPQQQHGQGHRQQQQQPQQQSQEQAHKRQVYTSSSCNSNGSKSSELKT
mmetsp:Transcript_21204/g.58851  ORF Transcript_21204/g.58851 Transcript_21204/m.58851 type:complete len:139 (+) Transcript_21204:556-972(+)